MQETYEEYALLDAQMAELEAKKKGLRVKILEHLVAEGTESITTTLGKFTVSPLKSWSYPDAIGEREEELKEIKARMQSTGEATYVEVPSLRFTGMKI